MSSSNPFRRSVVQDVSSVAPLVTQSGSRSGSSYGALQMETEFEPDPKPTPKSRTKKHVRITSPPHSPEPSSPVVQHKENEQQDYFPIASFSRITLQRRGSRSPPPPITPEEEALSLREQQAGLGAEEEGDSSTDDEELARNTRRNSGTVEGEQTPTLPARPNPFQRTLADIDPSAVIAPDRESKQAQLKPSVPSRASLDVDSFKRLLMTGSAAAQSSGLLPPSPSKGLVPDNSSSTDTSSISHNSMFEAIAEHNMESPRTSYELDLSDDDERSSLIEEGPAVPKKDKKKKPPPPPKHKHGKGFTPAVSMRAPQTVSFFDFKPSFSASADGTTTPPMSTAAGTSPLQRTNSNLNKPLPPNPPMSPRPPLSSTPTPLSPETIEAQPIPQDPLASPTLEKQKKMPPPPPISRRHSQLVKASNAATRSRSNSNLSTVSGPPTDLSVSDHLPQSAKSPPPPPTRRAAPTTGTPLAPTINPAAESSSPNIDNLTRPNRSTSLGSHPPAPSDSISPGSTPVPLEATPSKPPISPPTTRPSPSPSSSLAIAPPPPPPRRSNRRSVGSETSPTESRRSSFETPLRRPSGASMTSSLRREVGAIHEELDEATTQIVDAQKALADGRRRISEAAGEGIGAGAEKADVRGVGVEKGGAGVDDFLKGLDDLQREVEEMQRRAKGVGG